MYLRFIGVLVLVVGCWLVTPGQNLTKKELKTLLAEVAADEQRVTECEKARTEAQIKEFGKPLPKIAGHCWGGCPTSVVKPHYPDRASRNRFTGRVTISAIVDESGKVVYAKMIKGNAIFRQAALTAAYASTYQPKVTCGNRPIKFRWRINYLFTPDL